MFTSIQFDRSNPSWFRLSKRGRTLLVDTTEIRTIEWSNQYDIWSSLKHRRWIGYFKATVTYKNGAKIRFSLADEGINHAIIESMLV